jgi:hypothetical protein
MHCLFMQCSKLLCKIFLLCFVHRVKYKITMFRKLDTSSGRKMRRGQKTCLLCSLAEQASAFIPEDGSNSAFETL